MCSTTIPAAVLLPPYEIYDLRDLGSLRDGRYRVESVRKGFYFFWMHVIGGAKRTVGGGKSLCSPSHTASVQFWRERWLQRGHLRANSKRDSMERLQEVFLLAFITR